MKNEIRKFFHYLETYISSAQEKNVCLFDFQVTWMIAEIRASFIFVLFFFFK